MLLMDKESKTPAIRQPYDQRCLIIMIIINKTILTVLHLQANRLQVKYSTTMFITQIPVSTANLQQIRTLPAFSTSFDSLLTHKPSLATDKV